MMGLKLKDILEMTAGASYAADPGEPDTGFLEGGEKRTLGTLKGKPEPWYDGGGYTQMHFPKADHIYGKGKPADYKFDQPARRQSSRAFGQRRPDHQGKKD